jgi:2-hydroxy-3-keto-5-methylthiopentenyl-1-phosphate phosphatase
MTRAPSVPVFTAGGIPVSFLIDYDGTIAATDVGMTLLDVHSTDPAWRAIDDEYVAGRLGSRGLMEWNLEILPRDASLLRATAAAQPHDPTFEAFVERVRAFGAAIEVVSDGIGFYVHEGLERLGLADLPVATAELEPDSVEWRLKFPYGHPTCHVCGTCKRGRVFAHRAAGRATVFVGDGESDRYASAHADVVFAKGHLVDVCTRQGWPFHPWRTFADIATWAEAALASGELPADPADLEAWLADRPGRTRGFVCGPEVWGVGRRDPVVA